MDTEVIHLREWFGEAVCGLGVPDNRLARELNGVTCEDCLHLTMPWLCMHELDYEHYRK